ncbi:bacteriohopanetetrol glucosamine biosynthesis glycosyltransferase HpnI [Novosphingobium sp. LASN5T]|uniref:bacteriohopanetetrol glucosamine biosynthesis glycosyltransferase HpnI n=1 Tax=Novosphingobium sp. LASN5T TaxID=2491021 RepID=UPI000F5DE5FD|nr:bacteriohopanetetrol glucosamine biosynthesis glycosyltransferase HpnI [Novosphingobium sp. LASN5T]RQW45358.1 glycosyltransferase [Novosphingobium sp. LASN5T]
MPGVALLLSATGWVLLALATIGTAYMAFATRVLARFLVQHSPASPRATPVTLLKPLYGAEPKLAENLATFLKQDHEGPVQVLFGVQRADDPAIAAVRALQRCYPAARIDLVIDGTPHGSNGKVGNLINMMRQAAHDVLILSDSDMAVARDYIAQVLAALDQPGTGAVTCLYRGRGDAGFWSRLASAGPSYQFLVGLVFAKTRGLADPCMGSTIALRRETLDAIGGFTAFADVLADDHAIGQAVRARGLAIAIPPLLLVHASTETAFAQLWKHELRWAATVRGVSPAGYAGSFIGIPLPMALAGMAIHPNYGLAITLAALAVRVATVRVVDRHAGEPTAPLWTLPLRDGISFAVFVASFFVRSVDWRGTELTMLDNGRVAAPSEMT